MAIGKLYKPDSEEFLVNVDYQLQQDSRTSWWGEFVLVEYMRLGDGTGYFIELEDNRKGRCSIKKRVNRAVTGVPPRYIYRFAGTSPLE